MPPIFLPFALLYALSRELWLLFKKPKYRALMLWLGIVLLTGTVFYHRIEGWGWIDSFYFSVITLTTVGYGDLSPTNPLSKLFTVGYIFFGLTIVLTLITQLARERVEIHDRRFYANTSYDPFDGADGDDKDRDSK